MSSNPVLKVSGTNLARLKDVLKLCTNDKACGYHADSEQITFFWAQHEQTTPFPAPLSTDRLAEIAFEWLQGAAKYKQQPDHDGDNEKGWLCSCDAWGHVDGFGWQAFVSVKPFWVMYGK